MLDSLAALLGKKTPPSSAKEIELRTSDDSPPSKRASVIPQDRAHTYLPASSSSVHSATTPTAVTPSYSVSTTQPIPISPGVDRRRGSSPAVDAVRSFTPPHLMSHPQEQDPADAEFNLEIGSPPGAHPFKHKARPY